MRNIPGIIFSFCLCGLLLNSRADTFPLADGAALTGDVVKTTDAGMMLHLGDNTYTNVPWTKFSQEALKQLSSQPKIKPFVEPFIEIPLSERPQKPAVKINEVSRLELPPRQSLLGALFSSSPGLFALLLLYAANLYAAYEIAVVRLRPKGLVLGVAAVLPILGPILFIALPQPVPAAPVEAAPEVDPVTFAVPGEPASEDLHVTGVTPGSAPAANTGQAAGQVFKRGQFTFNRRFIESKFSAFMGQTRGAAEAQSVFILTTASGPMIVERITQIAAADMQVEVMLGETRQEVAVPFADIQEIQIRPKDV